jgi:hypothetical protein
MNAVIALIGMLVMWVASDNQGKAKGQEQEPPAAVSQVEQDGK